MHPNLCAGPQTSCRMFFAQWKRLGRDWLYQVSIEEKTSSVPVVVASAVGSRNAQKRCAPDCVANMRLVNCCRTLERQLNCQAKGQRAQYCLVYYLRAGNCCLSGGSLNWNWNWSHTKEWYAYSRGCRTQNYRDLSVLAECCSFNWQCSPCRRVATHRLEVQTPPLAVVVVLAD